MELSLSSHFSDWASSPGPPYVLIIAVKFRKYKFPFRDSRNEILLEHEL